MHNLCLDWDVLHAFVGGFNRLFRHDCLLDFPPNVLDLCLNCVVVSNGPLDGDTLVVYHLLVLYNLTLNWNSVHFLDLLVLYVLLLEGNVLDPALHGDLLGHCLMIGTSGLVNIA